MKRLMLAILMAFAFTAAAVAGDGIKVTSGSFAPFKNGGTATVTINMENAKFDNKKALVKDERFANVGENVEEFRSEFIREFNEKAKKFKCVTEGDAEYKIAIDVTNVDTYVRVMSFSGAIGIKIWGTVTILDKAETPVTVVELKEFEDGGMTYMLGLENTFEELAEQLGKRFNKGK